MGAVADGKIMEGLGDKVVVDGFVNAQLDIDNCEYRRLAETKFRTATIETTGLCSARRGWKPQSVWCWADWFLVTKPLRKYDDDPSGSRWLEEVGMLARRNGNGWLVLVLPNHLGLARGMCYVVGKGEQDQRRRRRKCYESRSSVFVCASRGGGISHLVR